MTRARLAIMAATWACLAVNVALLLFNAHLIARNRRLAATIAAAIPPQPSQPVRSWNLQAAPSAPAINVLPCVTGMILTPGESCVVEVPPFRLGTLPTLTAPRDTADGGI